MAALAQDIASHDHAQYKLPEHSVERGCVPFKIESLLGEKGLERLYPIHLCYIFIERDGIKNCRSWGIQCAVHNPNYE